jgi:hypothetical protein
MFENPLFLGQWRKVILSFPITQGIRESLKHEGWFEIDIFYHADKGDIHYTDK